MVGDKQESEVLKLFDQEERGYLHRLRDMLSGLTKPRDSLAYKEAIRELQRQWAPLLGVFIPVAICVVMCSITIGGANDMPKPTNVTVMEPTKADPLEPIDPPPPPDPIEMTEDVVENLDITVSLTPLGEVSPDVPAVNPPVQMTPATVTLAGVPTRGSGDGGIGGGVRLAGDMVGMFVDLSCDANGNPRPELKDNVHVMNHKDTQLYKDLRYILEKGLGREAFTPFHVIPQRVYLSHLVLPYVSSSIGPKTYKVEKSVQNGAPWLAVYKGKLQPEESGVYRLAGLYDDVLVVRVNGKEVLEFSWHTRLESAGKPTTVGTGWAQKDAAVAGKHKMRGFQNTPLAYGDWFELKANQSVPVEIIIGDNGGDGRQGGLTGGILLVEKKGETYAKTPDGIPLLPPFCTTRLTFNEHQRLMSLADPTNTKTSGHYAFADRSVPVMNTCGKKTSTLTQDDVPVETGDL